jgi:hypothetical protein
LKEGAVNGERAVIAGHEPAELSSYGKVRTTIQSPPVAT